LRIIAGPCVHENLELSKQIAEHCQNICDKYNIDYYFKASFDKANRSNFNSHRGEGLATYLTDMYYIDSKKITDVHEVWQIGEVKSVVDVIQIPAFLCRQTDLIVEACKTDCIVNIKKGQFLAPWDIKNIISKCNDARAIWITERGTSFGYNRLVVDYCGLVDMLRNYGNSVVFDGTHSVQRPGGGGDTSNGDSSFVPSLLYAAAAVGIKSFFLEVHPEPWKSPSDGDNMLLLRDFEEIVYNLAKINTLQLTDNVI